MQIKNGLTVIAAKSIAASTITTKVAVKLAYQRISEIKVLIKSVQLRKNSVGVEDWPEDIFYDFKIMGQHIFSCSRDNRMKRLFV